MKIIIPMAGVGKRLRPHTLVTPKPLFPIAGKPIVQRLVEDIVRIYGEQVKEIAYVIGDFEQSIQELLIQTAERLGAKPRIYFQHKPHGTAHAVWCARESIDDEIIIAFADTLFFSTSKLSSNNDANIWVKAVPNPSAYGVVTLNEQNQIKAFVEKPQEPISNLAIIGIYHFKNYQALMNNINYLVANDVRSLGEIQLTDALQRMKEQGCTFGIYEVQDWMDCGNKDMVLSTNAKILGYYPEECIVPASASIKNSHLIPPYTIGENVKIENSVIGPYVSIGSQTSIQNSVVKNSIIQENASLKNVVIENSVLGRHASCSKEPYNLNLGDYSHG